MGFEFNYQAHGRVLNEFMNDTTFVRGIQGHIGSGKSVASAVECFKLMLGQEPDAKGRRRTRGAIIRNTGPELETTTMKTWLEWFPEEIFGRMRWRSPFMHHFQIPEIGVDAEVWFLALDREEDVKKLLSLELSWAWLNEARELRRNVVTAAISRVGRFPRQIDGGVTRKAVIMDTNAPDEEHWWSIMSGQVEPPDWMNAEDRLTLIKPDNWRFFMQPPAVLDRLNALGELVGYDLNPERDNAPFTTDSYYADLMTGQTRDWIRNMLQNKIGRIFTGRAVYRDFVETTHVARERIYPAEGHTLHIGVDFGLTPAASFGQDVHGQMRTIDELVTRDTPATAFAQMLVKHIHERGYSGLTISLCGDPAGAQRAGTDARTPFQIFQAAGLNIKPAWSNEPDIRIGAIQTQLVTMVDGKPGYLLSPNCTMNIAGKAGGYAYKKDQEEIDKKSIYSHLQDAEQYQALDMGYGKKLIGRGQNTRSHTQAQTQQNVFNRGGSPTSRPSMLDRRTPVVLSRGR